MKGISQNATETVTILKGLGYHLDTLVRVLYYDFNKGVGSIQSILQGLNYSLPDILDSIASVLGL
jgi:hypothetical protein